MAEGAEGYKPVRAGKIYHEEKEGVAKERLRRTEPMENSLSTTGNSLIIKKMTWLGVRGEAQAGT